MNTQIIEQFSLQAAPLRVVLAPSIVPITFQLRQAEDRDSEWKKAIRKIHRMLALRDDWDGLGAKAPSSATVDHAIRVARAKLNTRDYPAPTRVIATPAGTIGLEWQKGPVYTEAEVGGSNQSDWMQIIPGREPTHWSEYVPEESVESPDPSPPQSLPQVYWAKSLR